MQKFKVKLKNTPTTAQEFVAIVEVLVSRKLLLFLIHILYINKETKE